MHMANKKVPRRGSVQSRNGQKIYVGDHFTTITIPDVAHSHEQLKDLKGRLKAELEKVEAACSTSYDDVEWEDLDPEERKQFQYVPSMAEHKLGADVVRNKKAKMWENSLQWFGIPAEHVEITPHYVSPYGKDFLSDTTMIVGNVLDIEWGQGPGRASDNRLRRCVDVAKGHGIQAVDVYHRSVKYGDKEYNLKDFVKAADNGEILIEEDAVTAVDSLMNTWVPGLQRDMNQSFARSWVRHLESGEVQSELWKETRRNIDW